MISVVLVIYVIVSAVVGTFLLWYSADAIQETGMCESKVINKIFYAGIALIWLVTILGLGNFVYNLF